MTYEPSYDPRGYLPLDARWLPCIQAYNPGEAEAICATYDSGCATIGYDANAAIAQGCVETGYFNSDRWRNSHNAAGIGIYSDGTPDIIWGPKPHGDVETGVHAQLDLLTDYYTDGSEPYGTLAPHGFGGMVLGDTMLSQMDGVWAEDTGYSEAIVGVMNEVIPEDGGEGTGMVTTKDVMRKGFTQYGHEYSGDFDTVNGNHPWAYWCLSFVDSAHRQAGLNPPLYPSAVVAGQSYALTSGMAPFGAACFFGTSYYYPDGHACLSIGEGWMLSTVEDGNGVGLKYIPPETPGFMGWCYYDGVSADITPDPPPVGWYVQPGNPYQQEGEDEIGIGGGFLRKYNAVQAGEDPMTVYGYARARENQATVTEEDGSSQERTVQHFQRGDLIYQPEQPYPWDVVAALSTQTIKDLPAGGA